MMSSRERGFQIAQNDAQPFERLDFRARLTSRCLHNFMLVVEPFEHFKSEQSIRSNAAARRDCSLRPWRQPGKGKASNWVEAHSLRTPIPHFYRRHKCHFIFRSATRPSAGSFTPKIGIVDAYFALERAIGLALSHDLHQLMLEQPGGLPRDAQLTHHRQSRDIRFRLRHQIDDQVPFRQWQPAVVHDGPGTPRALIFACLTLPVSPSVPSEFVRARVCAFRAFKTAGPTRVHQGRLALRFVP